MSLVLCENQRFFIKQKSNFCNLTGKVFFFKFIVIIYLISILMLHYSTYIYLVVNTYKTRQNIFVFYPKIRHFNIQVQFG